MNPVTAYLILTEFVTFHRGDWIISTAATSAVGRSVIPIAKARGIKTVNVVRSHEFVAELTALGGDIVLVDGPDLPRQIAAATGNVRIPLALDGVGGPMTQRLLNSIGLYGKTVLWSRMSGEPSTIDSVPVLFTGKSLHGFWILNWLKIPGNQERLTAIYEELAPLVTSGSISIPVAGEFALDQYLSAIEVASKLKGKAILKPNGL